VYVITDRIHLEDRHFLANAISDRVFQIITLRYSEFGNFSEKPRINTLGKKLNNINKIKGIEIITDLCKFVFFKLLCILASA
jgi:hypothetical protein